jgi:hypothetical protein
MTTLLLTASDERAWATQAKCRGRTHLFFGPGNERPEARVRRENLAARYCAVCPVMMSCRTWARENGENGFWGGESEEDRARVGFPPRSVTRRSVAAARDSSAA